MQINYFEQETIFVNENGEKNPFIKFTTNNNNIYLFQNLDNSIIYYDDNSHSVRNLCQYKKLSLINFCIFDYKEFICLLYSNGDFLFISQNYILNENFESFWESISKNLFDLNEYLKSSNENSKKNNLFSDLLACAEINVLNKKNFYFINIFKTFKNYFNNEEEERIISFSSLQIWKYKIHEYLLITYENCLFFLSFGEENKKECDFEFKLLYKFYYSLYNINYVNFKENFQLLIVQTEDKYYHINLIDYDNNINILTNEKEIQINELNISSNSILSIQEFNQEKVICFLTENNTFEIYNLFDLKNPTIQIDLNDNKFLLNKNTEIIACYLYKKLLLIIIKKEKKYFIIVINYWLGTHNKIENLVSNNKIWCNIDYNLLENLIIINEEINMDIVNTTFDNFHQDSIFIILSKKKLNLFSTKIENNLLICLGKYLNSNFSFESLRKIELLNNGLNGNIFDSLNLLFNEMDKKYHLLLELIWNYSNETNLKLENFISKFNGNTKELNLEFIIQFLVTNLYNRGSLNIKNFKFLLNLYQKISKSEKSFYSEHLLKNFEILYGNSIIQKSIVKENLKLDVNNNLSISLNQLNISGNEISEENENDSSFIFTNNKRKKTKIKDNNVFSFTVTNSKFEIISLFEKILFFTILINQFNPELIDSEKNYINLQMELFHKNCFKDSICSFKSFKILIINILIDESITITKTIIEEISILKLKKMKNVNEIKNLIFFLIDLLKLNEKIRKTTNRIYINLLSFLDIENKKEERNLNEIFDFFKLFVIPFALNIWYKGNSLYLDNKCIYLNIILIITFIYFFNYQKLNQIDKENLNILNNFLTLISQSELYKNKNISKYIDNLQKELNQNDDLIPTNNNIQFFDNFYELIKQNKDKLTQKEITIYQLIQNSNGNILNLRKLENLFNKKNK